MTSAAKSSRRSAASFARRRAARARARGVVKSCWTGNGRRVGGVDAPPLVVDPETRTVNLGVARADGDNNVNSAEGTKDAKVMFDVIP